MAKLADTCKLLSAIFLLDKTDYAIVHKARVLVTQAYILAIKKYLLKTDVADIKAKQRTKLLLLINYADETAKGLIIKERKDEEK